MSRASIVSGKNEQVRCIMNIRALFKYNRKTVKVYDDGNDWAFISSDGERWFTKHTTLSESVSLGMALDKYTDSKVMLTDLDYV